MSDTTTLPPPAPPVTADTGPTVRQRRSLPGGRAVVGAFLVIAASVGTFGAYLQATAEPATSYLVATGRFEVGEVLTADDLRGGTSRVDFVAMDVPSAQAAGLYSRDAVSLDDLVGTLVAAPVAPGDLFPRSAVVAAGEGTGVSLSFSLPADRALNGAVKVSERVDVIATFPSSGATASETRVVARGVTVVAVVGAGEGIGGGRVSLTVRVGDLATAQLLQHAVDVADVALVRGADADSAAPSPTRSDAAPRSSGAGGHPTDTTDGGA